jgi:hypothetical protein
MEFARSYGWKLGSFRTFVRKVYRQVPVQAIGGWSASTKARWSTFRSDGNRDAGLRRGRQNADQNPTFDCACEYATT